MTNLYRLYQLIQSLTKSEKRSFRLFVSAYNKNKSQGNFKLFDILDKEKTYDNKALREKLSSFKWVEDQISYLYGLILKSLSVFHTGKSVSAEIREILTQVDVLKKKGLHEHAEKLIHSAKDKAYENELFNELLELIEWEKEKANFALFSLFCSKDLHSSQKLFTAYPCTSKAKAG